MLIPSSLAFDFYVDSETSDFNSIAVSPDGTFAIVSSDNDNYRGTFLEKIDSTNVPPVRISDKPSVNVGFFGNSSKMIAFEADGVLSIYNLLLLRTVRRVRILPGSLFTSMSGSASYVGAVSPGKRKVFYVDESGKHYISDTTLLEGALPIWTSSTNNGIFFAGQAWSDDDSVKMSIRSYDKEQPSVVTSSSSVSIFQGIDAAEGVDNIQRVLFTTMDEPGVIKRLEKRIGSNEPVVSTVSENNFDGVSFTSMVTDNNLRPVLGVSYDSVVPLIARLSDDDQYINLLGTRIFRNSNRCQLNHMGRSSLVSFTENPAMSPLIDVQDYSLPGRPIKRIECQSPVGCVPGENSINRFETSDSRYIPYRTVSKWSTEKTMVQEAVIIPDSTYKIVGGGYSPMVSSLVSAGVPVIIVKANTENKNSSAVRSMAADISELARHLVKKRVASRIGLICDQSLTGIVEAILSSRKMSKSFSRIDAFEPNESFLSAVRSYSSLHTNLHISHMTFTDIKLDRKADNAYIHDIGETQHDVVKYITDMWGNL